MLPKSLSLALYFWRGGGASASEIFLSFLSDWRFLPQLEQVPLGTGGVARMNAAFSSSRDPRVEPRGSAELLLVSLPSFRPFRPNVT